MIDRARKAEERGDWLAAMEFWRSGRVHFAELPLFWASEAAMLLLLGRPDEAEDLARRGIAAFPDNIDVAAQYVNVAIETKNWIAATTRWNALSRQFGDHVYVQTEGDAISARLDEGLVTVADHAVLAAAVEAAASLDWRLAARFWAPLHRSRPKDPGIIIGLGTALRESGVLDQADTVLSEGMRLHPRNAEMAANHAEVSASGCDWPEASRRWQKVLLDFPDVPGIWSMAATACRENGQYETTRKIIENAEKTEASGKQIHVQWGKLAAKEERWVEAIRQFDAAHRLAPDDLELQNWRGDAIWHETAARLEAGDVGEAVNAASAAASATGDASRSWKQIALNFEGLGDNCEFGILQRRLGADPIGLLRFGAVSIPNLIELLGEEFERLGDPEFTVIEKTMHGGDEYLVRDTRELYLMHTFIKTGTVDEEKLYRQQVARIGYLKRKLVEDLRESDKIFVYKSSFDRIDHETARRLHRAVCRYGSNTLLLVHEAEPDEVPGSVVQIDRGLLLGCVRTTWRGGDHSAIDIPSWRSILQAACDFTNGPADPAGAAQPGAGLPGDHDGTTSPAVEASLAGWRH